jgi:hypothetical protein
MVRLLELLDTEVEGTTLFENVRNFFASHHGVISQKI